MPFEPAPPSYTSLQSDTSQQIAASIEARIAALSVSLETLCLLSTVCLTWSGEYTDDNWRHTSTYCELESVCLNMVCDENNVQFV
jgi:hypothetical protein